MAAKPGQITHFGNGEFLLDRLQSAGASNINVNEEKQYELGNPESVETTRDTPTVQYDLESQDMTCELEALVCDIDPTTVNNGDSFDFRDAKPSDIAARYKPDLVTESGEYGAAVPYLTLESVQYRFGVRQSAGETFSFRGDSFYPVPGTPYVEDFDGDGATQTFNFTHTPAIPTTELGDSVYALCVTYITSDGDYQRLYLGDDFTNTPTSVTLTDITPAVGERVRVEYAVGAAISLPQSIHPLASVKPGAVKSRNIKLYISDGAATPSLDRVFGAQSIETGWRVTLEAEEELGNQHYVAQDYDVPEVSGTITMRARTIRYLFEFIAQITGTPTNEIPNILSSLPLEMVQEITHPTTGAVMKTLYVSDARFQVPAIPARVQQKLEQQIQWSSDGGNLEVFQGAMP